MKNSKSLKNILAISLLAAFCITIIITNNVLANAGNGSVITPIGNSNDYGFEVVIQDDGKILVGGGTYDAPYYQMVLVRYNSDLSLDENFGNGGIVITETDFGVYFGIQDIALQSDGKIVVTTPYNTESGKRNFSVFRYNSDGTLDTGFGNGGYVTTPFSNYTASSWTISAQDDGKIVLGGGCDSGACTDFCAARYNSDGSLDTSFSGDGIVVTRIGAGYDQTRDMLLQDDGKIILTGMIEMSRWSGQHDLGMIRYNPDGSLDTAFGNGGYVITDFGTSYEYGTTSVLQPDGKIILSGLIDHQRAAQGLQDMGLVRYHTDGSIDTSFGDGGKVIMDIVGTSDYSYGIAFQDDGKIVVTGATNNGTDYDIVVLRYNSNGSLDSTFGTEGIEIIDFGLGDDTGFMVAIDNNGKIIVVGHTYNGSDQDILVMRLRPDGSIDDNTPPVAQAGGPYSVDEGNTVTLNGSGSDPDNDPLTFAWDLDNGGIFEMLGQSVVFSAVGLDGPNTQTVAVQVCDTYNGCDVDDTEIQISNVAPIVDAGVDTQIYNLETLSVNASFTDPGTTDTHTATIDWGDGPQSASVSQASGSGMVTGSHNFSDPDTYTVEICVTDNDGDTGCDSLEIDVRPSLTVDQPSVTVDEGQTATNSGTIISLGGSGSLDPSFGDDGTVTLPIGDGDDIGTAVAIQADGKIVVAGHTDNGIDRDFAVVRYNPDGTLDSSFGGSGIVITDFGYHDNAEGIAIQADGKIVVVGRSVGHRIGYPYHGVWAIARYNSDGSLDTTFSGDGKVTTDIGSSIDGADSVAIQDDGKIVVGGTEDNKVPGDFAVVRYNNDGSIDTTFGVNGIVDTPLSSGYDVVQGDIHLQDDGKIILTGWAEMSPSYKSFAAVRYNADGNLDPTFDGDGIVTTDFGGRYDYCFGSALQSDGKIVLAGFTDYLVALNYDIAIARYNPSGSLDTTFDGDGKLTVDLGSTSEAIHGVVLQPDGKIVLAGSSGGDIVVMRYNSDGSPDTTFGENGLILTDFNNGTDNGSAVVLQSDGKIVVAGSANNGTNQDFALARYYASGGIPPILSASIGIVSNNGDGTWSWSYDAMDGPLQSQMVTIYAEASNGNSDQVNFELIVNNVSPDVDTPIVDPEPSNEGVPATVSALFSDPAGDLDAPYTCSVNYGDGSGDMEGTINGYICTGPAYSIADNGLYSVTVSVTDKDGDTGYAIVEYVVNNVAPAITILELDAYSINEGETVILSGDFNDPGLLDRHTIVINWMDGSTDTLQFSSGERSFSISHPYLDDDPSGTTFDEYSIGVTITDNDGDSANGSVILTVNNHDPIVGDIVAPLDPVQINTEITVSVDFTDQGIQDTHTVSWDWGDDTSSEGIVTESNGSGTITGSHIYETPGVYTVVVTVIDDDNGSAVSVFQYVVIYDPDGGFVTGGGWFNSPAGAYYPDSTLTGKATFGFVSKYKKGTTIPTGNTEFQFKVADLNFHSTEYQWLVVAGAKAKFKGFGTINGDGNYGFMISAVDENLTPSTDVDLFRIKIWDIDNGDVVIYDNLLGVDDDADPTTALGGGSIVIHKAK